MEEGEGYDYILYLYTKTWEFMDGYTYQISDKYKKLIYNNIKVCLLL